MPNKVPVEVLNVWLDQDEVGYLVGGENARVRLKDISDEDIQPGYVLSRTLHLVNRRTLN